LLGSWMAPTGLPGSAIRTDTGGHGAGPRGGAISEGAERAGTAQREARRLAALVDVARQRNLLGKRAPTNRASSPRKGRLVGAERTRIPVGLGKFVEDETTRLVLSTLAAFRPAASRFTPLVHLRADVGLHARRDRGLRREKRSVTRLPRVDHGTGATLAHWYAEQPWPGSLVVTQLGLELLSSIVSGLTIAITARPSGVFRMSPAEDSATARLPSR
jgi:hypothetical protein